jgi:hypothetical protein
MGKSGHHSSSNKFPIASPIPRDLSHRPHIHGAWPPPASRASQPEQTTWWAELGDGRAALDDGQAELDNRRSEDRAGGDLGDQGRTLLEPPLPHLTRAPTR